MWKKDTISCQMSYSVPKQHSNQAYIHRKDISFNPAHSGGQAPFARRAPQHAKPVVVHAPNRHHQVLQSLSNPEEKQRQSKSLRVCGLNYQSGSFVRPVNFLPALEPFDQSFNLTSAHDDSRLCRKNSHICSHSNSVSKSSRMRESSASELILHQRHGFQRSFVVDKSSMRNLFSEGDRYPSALSSIMHALKDREEAPFFNCSPIARKDTAPPPRLHICLLYTSPSPRDS